MGPYVKKTIERIQAELCQPNLDIKYEYSESSDWYSWTDTDSGVNIELSGFDNYFDTYSIRATNRCSANRSFLKSSSLLTNVNHMIETVKFLSKPL
jgi:hypothetical protein